MTDPIPKPAEFDSSRPLIVYIGPFAFPGGGAAARRILGNAQGLVAAGYQVLILSGQQAESEAVRKVAPGIFLASTSERDAEHLPRALRLVRYALMGSKSRRWMDRLSARPYAVLLYSGYTPYILQLKGWCRRNGVPLLFDAVEWYTATSPLGLITSPYLWQIEFAMRRLIPRLDGVIAISGYLRDWFNQAHIPVVQVPPTLDVRAVIPGEGGGQKRLSLVYAGTPGQSKDQLGEIIAAVRALDPQGRDLVLNLYGPTADQIRQLLATAGHTVPQAVVAHGPVDHAVAMAAVGRADFSILTRRRNRVSSAGFPTKFVESLAMGTPVIANLTGDMGNYLRDGENGLVCDSACAVSIGAALRRALALTDRQRCEMRARARATAETAFDYREYVDRLQYLVQTAAYAMDGSKVRTGI